MDVENHPPRAVRGITLVEMLTTLAVASVSLAMLAPGWSSLSDRSQITTVANSLLTDLRFARSTAVSRNWRVGLCPSADGSRCGGDPKTWHDGYIIFSDDDGDRDRSAGEPLLRVQGARPKGLRLHSTAGRPVISFRGDGAAWSTNTTFSVCQGDNPDSFRAVVLYGSGRARVDRRMPRNRPVTCG